jgi:hypothetical protein
MGEREKNGSMGIAASRLNVNSWVFDALHSLGIIAKYVADLEGIGLRLKLVT